MNKSLLKNEFKSSNNRIHTVIGFIKACDVASTDAINIIGYLCVDNQTGNMWCLDITYFNPFRWEPDTMRYLYLMDKSHRNKYGYLYNEYRIA